MILFIFALTGAATPVLSSAPATRTDPLPLQNIVQIAAGGVHTCALATAGGVLCWGDNSYGQLGNGSAARSSNVPVAVSGLSSGVSAIGVSAGSAYALTSRGVVLCWGDVRFSQLGNASIGWSTIPVDVLASNVAGD